jgi:hypothetical protein
VGEIEDAADLRSTKEWTYRTSCTAPQGCRRDRPATRNYDMRLKQTRSKSGKGKGGNRAAAEDRWSLIPLVTPVATDGDRWRRERQVSDRRRGRSRGRLCLPFALQQNILNCVLSHSCERIKGLRPTGPWDPLSYSITIAND